jgi:hypothetical protein
MLNRLYGRFADRVAFLTLYVPEAHPGDRYPQPDNIEQKMRFAHERHRRDALGWPVVVDGIGGRLHQQLDPKPNAVYLMGADGRVAFRALWSKDREGILSAALDAGARGRSPVGQHQGRMIPMMRGLAEMDRMLESSGRRRAVTCSVRPTGCAR